MFLHRGAPQHDAVPLRSPGGFGIKRRIGGQRGPRTAGRRHRLEMPAAARPGDIGHRAAVGSPGRHELVLVGIGEADRGATREVHPVEPAEGGKDDGAPVRRDARPAHDAGGDGRSVLHPARKVEPRRHRRLHPGLERDGRHRAGLEVNPADAAADGGDQRRAVRGEGVAGHGVAAGAGLLIVAGHAVDQPPFLAGPEVAHPERGLAPVAGGIDKPAPVRTQDRAHRAPRRAGDRDLVAGLAIKADHLPDGELRVVVEGAAPLGEIDEAAVRGGDRAEAVQRLRSAAGSRLGGRFAEADAAPAVPVDQEDPGGAVGRPGTRHQQVFAVGGPPGGHHELGTVAGGAVFGDRPRFAPVRARDPEVLDAAAVAQEGDLGSVRREDRLALEGELPDDPRRLATRDRQGVEVSEQLEDDGLPVRSHIERHPGPLGDGERQRLRSGEGKALPALFGVPVILGGGERGQQEEENGSGGKGKTGQHHPILRVPVLIGRSAGSREGGGFVALRCPRPIRRPRCLSTSPANAVRTPPELPRRASLRRTRGNTSGPRNRRLGAQTRISRAIRMIPMANMAIPLRMEAKLTASALVMTRVKSWFCSR